VSAVMAAPWGCGSGNVSDRHLHSWEVTAAWLEVTIPLAHGTTLTSIDVWAVSPASLLKLKYTV
jgi:hypothetical protein